jgi:cysteinyl-tRNA synthetase
VLDQPHHMMQWDSPWGRGYPGWHIECSAMSMKYLGATLDIHSGGLDHIPVHHENEIAQSESATGQPFVRYFVHNAFLVGMEGAKISKSTGKFPVVADLLKAGINPLAFRMLCLGAKYRSELAFSLDAVRGAERNLDYLYEFARNIRENAIGSAASEWVADYQERFHLAVNNDLNTSQALAAVNDMVGEAYRRNDHNVWPELRGFDQVLGLGLEEKLAEASEEIFPERVLTLKDERERARAAKDFKRSDELRLELEALGYSVKDTKAGMTLIPKRSAP